MLHPRKKKVLIEHDISHSPNDHSQKKEQRNLFFYSVLIVFSDLLAIITCFFAPWFLRIGIYGQGFSLNYLLAVCLFIFAFLFLAFSDNLYKESNFWSSRWALYHSLKVMCLSFGVLLLLAFTVKETASFSRLWGGTWLLLLSFYFCLSRLSFPRLMNHLANQGIIEYRVLLAGNNAMIEFVADILAKDDSKSLDLVGYVSEEGASQNIDLIYLGKGENLDNTISKYKIDDLIICEDWLQEKKIHAIIELASHKSVNIYLSPEKLPPFGTQSIQRVIGKLSMIEIDYKPLDKWQAFLKRVEDITISVFALLILWPIMTLTAIAIKCESKGPIFFQQPRFGFNNELINVLKFRSMHVDAADISATQLVTKDDPRITRIGKFIRKTSIDELPQLLNVLMGNMSLVGPRPHAIQAKADGKLYSEVVDRYAVRHRIKPGVTGWAQVNGWRGETDTEEKILKRIECDLYYIRNWSLFLDMYILLKTAVVVVLDNKNAY